MYDRNPLEDKLLRVHVLILSKVGSGGALEDNFESIRLKKTRLPFKLPAGDHLFRRLAIHHRTPALRKGGGQTATMKDCTLGFKGRYFSLWILPVARRRPTRNLACEVAGPSFCGRACLFTVPFECSQFQRFT